MSDCCNGLPGNGRGNFQGKHFWNASIAGEVYEAFKKIKLNKFKNFLDIGSGDGKVVMIASLFCKNAEGIEIDKSLHNKSVQIKNKFKIKILKGYTVQFDQNEKGEVVSASFIQPNGTFKAKKK